MADQKNSDHDHARSRYLIAKESVDTRARDQRVLSRLKAALPDRPHVVETGCGTGLAIPTLNRWGVTPASYHGIDTDAGIVAFARWLGPRVLRRQGVETVEIPDGYRVGTTDTDVTFQAGDALTILAENPPDNDADLLLAQSFLDLVPLGRVLTLFEQTIAPGGLVYAPLTFDGETILLPEHPADERIVEAFHADIDATSGRDSRAGRHLLNRLRKRGSQIEAVSASDWIVRPGPDGQYRADEQYFLECILAFIAGAETVMDIEGADAWIETRTRQLAAGELTYVAHGYDLLWRPRAGATAQSGRTDGEIER